MFDFFKRKNKDLEEDSSSNINDNIVASITFFVDSNNTPSIDISMMDYDKKSVEAMCYLLNIIATDQASIQAVDMIKNGLIQDNKEDILFEILTSIDHNITKKIVENTLKDKPCIKPSDML